MSHPPFPAAGASNEAHRPTYIPNMRKATTDVEERRFIRQAFDTIASGFEKSLADIAEASESLDFEFERQSIVEFTAEIFLHGKTKCRCRIWQGGPSSDGISYAEYFLMNIWSQKFRAVE